MSKDFGLLDKFRLWKLKRSSGNKIDEIDEQRETAIKIKNDSCRLEAIKLIKDESTKEEVARRIQDDKIKLEAIKLLKSDRFKRRIIRTIQDDNIKIKAIPFLKNEQYKIDILNSIKFFKKFDGQAIFELYTIILEENEEQNILEKMKDELEKVKTLENDDEKIEYINSVDSECLKSEVAKTIQDDDKKIDIIRKLKNDWSKAIVAKEIVDDSKKIEVISLIKDESYKAMVIKTIKDDDKKIKVLKAMINEAAKAEIADTIEDDDKKIELLEEISDEYKYTVILTIDNKSKQIDTVIKYCSCDEIREFQRNYKMESEEEKEKINEVAELLKRIEDAIDDDKKLELIADLNNERLKVSMTLEINDESKKIEAIKLLTPKWVKKFRNSCSDYEFLKDNIDLFIEKEGFSNQIDRGIIEELFKKNNEVVKNIDFKILKPEYIELFGKDKINLISCYLNVQEAILELETKQLKIFVKCIDDYMSDVQTEEWTTIAQSMLHNLIEGEYNNLIDSIEDLEKIDIDILRSILQNRNVFGIKKQEEISQYEQIKKSKTDSWIKSSSIEDKRLAVLEKVFGQDIEYAEKILTKYGQDIDSLPESDIKFYIKSLQEIMDCNSSEVFEKIYAECKEVTVVDKAFIERCIKTEFGKLYNDGLLKVEDTEELEENMYLAGTDFKMIITSVGAYVPGKKDKNYREDWNRPALGTQHFCTSYIRNDMIGTAPINDVCYGFTDMADDSLMLSGARDLGSSGSEAFVSCASRNEAYYSPEEQINNTVKHNELDFRRVQNGEKKQPSYIVVFRRNGKIPNLENAKRAQKDWGGLPIIIVDVDACLESEQKKVNTMIKEYRETNNPELARQIYYKIRNNRVTEPGFCKRIDIEQFNIELEESERKSEFFKEGVKEEKTRDKRSFVSDEIRKIESEEQQIEQEEDLEENHHQVTAYDRKEMMRKMKEIFKSVQKIKEEDRDIE